MSALEPTPATLVPICRMTLQLKPPVFVGAGPAGNRLVIEVEGGVVEGERLAGEIVGPGADWLVVGADGTGTVDVRLLVQTGDGASVFVQYLGRMDTNRGFGAPVSIAPRFETGDERYSWLNTVQGVGKGATDGNTIVYDIYELA
ncbi:MAG TPA: DUF3237 domain-containing protein [Acidimicrobiales bacterium]|nr:DUF3237 domain-containing protein [Acidimicrobiales bacterium]